MAEANPATAEARAAYAMAEVCATRGRGLRRDPHRRARLLRCHERWPQSHKE